VLRLLHIEDDKYLHNELLRLNKSEARVILLYATQYLFTYLFTYLSFYSFVHSFINLPIRSSFHLVVTFYSDKLKTACQNIVVHIPRFSYF